MTEQSIDRIRAERSRVYNAEPQTTETNADPLEAVAIEAGAIADRAADVVSLVRDRDSLLDEEGNPRPVAVQVFRDVISAHKIFGEATPRSPGSADGGARTDPPAPDAIREAQERGDTRAVVALKRRAAFGSNLGGDAA